KNGKPFAEIQAGNDWSITASHELLEMLVDPLGHKLIRDPDIDPASDGHQVEYLVEVGDPCEVFAYPINGISVSDFTTREFYDTKAPAGTQFDFLARLNKDRKSTRLNSSHVSISYAVFCLKKKT